MKTLLIKKHFQEDYISRLAGEKLRELILTAKDNGEKLQLDFSGVKIASVSFFDEGFAKLVQEGWTQKDLIAWIEFKNLDPRDRQLMNELTKRRGLK